MIIFDLDGTLANCDHRKHLIEPEKYTDLCEYSNYYIDGNGNPIVDLEGQPSWRYKKTGTPFKHGWHIFYEACDKDEPLQATVDILNLLSDHFEIQIWSTRCDSVKGKTIDWLCRHGVIPPVHSFEVKMRPVGDNTPDDVLKERWLDEYYQQFNCELAGTDNRNCCHKIDFIFDANPASIAMWKRRGIFVFNCRQHEE